MEYRWINESLCAVYSIAGFEELLGREDIDEVFFRFTDLDGRWVQFQKKKNTLSLAELAGGIHFSCGLPGWRGINASDYLIKADSSTFFLEACMDPPLAAYICDVWEPNGRRPYRRDPRRILKGAILRLNNVIPGAQLMVGPELEFYLLRNARYEHSRERSFAYLEGDEANLDCKNVEPPRYRRSGASGHLTPEFDTSSNIRRKIAENISRSGIQVVRHHHELGPGQNEISMVHSEALRAADSIQIHKHVVRSTAMSEGRIATFMPMPFGGTTGSGMHLHLSISRGEENLFSNGHRPPALSEMAMFAIGGILKHARALNCFLNPSLNSYRRLNHCFGVDEALGYGPLNRRTIVRIPPALNSQAARVEVRFADATANPYLAIACLIMAMLDGIERRIEPGAPSQGPLPPRTTNLSKRSSRRLAFDLHEAIEALDRDRQFLTEGNVFWDSLIDSHLVRMTTRVHEAMKYPHPIEFADSFAN
jgi:glutamine synthetase